MRLADKTGNYLLGQLWDYSPSCQHSFKRCSPHLSGLGRIAYSIRIIKVFQSSKNPNNISSDGLAPNVDFSLYDAILITATYLFKLGAKSTGLVTLPSFSKVLAETYQLNMPISWLNLEIVVHSTQNYLTENNHR